MAEAIASRPAQGGASFIPGIGGLRALAVLSVTLFHVNPAWLPGGFVGVDIFFVISGFVVAHSVYDRPDQGFTAYFLWFYRRRFQRILPAIFGFTLVATLAGVLLLPSGDATKYIDPTGAASLFGLSNFILLWKVDDYFAAASEFNTFTHTWSLAVEEQYYMLFPFFSYVLIVRPRSRRVGMTAVVAVTAISLLACMHFTARWPAFAFYMLPTRLWELGLGFMLRYWFGAAPPRSERALGTTGIVTAAGTLAVLAAVLWRTTSTGFPFPGAVLPALATAILIALSWRHPGYWLDRVLRLRALAWLGEISFSLYLWHWGVIVLMRWTIGIDTLPLQTLALGLMMTLACASYYGIERPFRYNQRLIPRATPRFFATFGVVALAIATLGASSRLYKPYVGLSATNGPTWGGPRAPVTGECPIMASKRPWRAGWLFEFEPQCPTRGAGHLYVAGDSHAGAYRPLLERVAATDGRAVSIYTFAGCNMISLEETPDPACLTFRREVTAEIARRARPGEAVFLAGLYMPRYRETGRDGAVPAQPAVVRFNDGPARVAATRAALQPLTARGLSILLEGPKPLMPIALFRCADPYTRVNDYCAPGWSVSRASLLTHSASGRAVIEELAATLPHARYWDPFPVLCPGAVCHGYRNGRPIYFDTDHLGNFGNDLLYPSFRAALGALTGPAGISRSPVDRPLRGPATSTS